MPSKIQVTPTPTPKTKLKPKTGLSLLTEPEQLELSQRYLSAHAKSDSGALVDAEATALKTAREAVLAKAQEESDAKALLDTKTIALVLAQEVHAGAIEEYAHRAAKVADGDLTVLTSLGVNAAATTRTHRVEGPGGVVTGIRVLEGSTSGSIIVKWPRPPGAAAFVAQYRLEGPPGAPAEWLPADGFITKKLEWKIDGLPPVAQIRVRIRAIGDEAGPWSDEVLGKAR